jgi:hypothetical protein
MSFLKNLKLVFEASSDKDIVTACKDKEQKLQHLQFIQDVITRHNTNSFHIKEFAVIIIAAVFGVYMTRDSIQPNFILIPAFTTFFLGCLDAVYLKQERQYRKLYRDAVEDKIALYDMNANKYTVCFFSVLLSKTIGVFYGSLIATILVLRYWFIK